MANVSTSYWRRNLQYVGSLLAVWFIVSYGCGILLADWLDQFKFAGFKLGFWFAQQGSIYVFVILILIYVKLMNRLDRIYGVSDEEDE
jgi:putative solute:sodium symporter small subunit